MAGLFSFKRLLNEGRVCFTNVAVDKWRCQFDGQECRRDVGRLTGNAPVSHQSAETGPDRSDQSKPWTTLCLFFLIKRVPPFPLWVLQQLPCGKRRWRAASQGEEKQEQQWQRQESGDEEISEPGGGPAGAPAAAETPQQTSGRQVGRREQSCFSRGC